MVESIRIYPEGSEEMNRLKLACYELERLSPNGTRYYVEDTYFDFGQDWMYSAIIASQGDGREWQAVNPRDYERILLSDNIPETCKTIVSGMYWYDPKPF